MPKSFNSIWYEVIVLFRAAATAETKRPGLACMRVQPTEREICGSGLLESNGRIYFHSHRLNWSVHFEENCFTRAFDPTQRRQLKPGSLPSIWGRKKPSTESDSTRQSRMKEKERQKLRFLWVLLMLYICALMHKMFDILISPI